MIQIFHKWQGTLLMAATEGLAPFSGIMDLSMGTVVCGGTTKMWNGTPVGEGWDPLAYIIQIILGYD